MEYGVNYPVNFVSGGDKVNEAFNKHIEEFKTVDSILNTHKRLIDDTYNKITNLETCDIDASRVKGVIDISRSTGDIDIGRVTGNLPGSRITGDLTNATIASGKVTGLDEHVKELVTGDVPASKLIDDIANSAKGYVKFGGGVILQWGYVDFEAGATGSVTRQANYAVPYPNACHGVFLSDGRNAGIFDGQIRKDAAAVSLVRETAEADYRVYYLSIGA